MPILWHVIRLYAAQGFDRFLLATGYRGELIERFVAASAWPEGVERASASTRASRPRPAGGSSCWRQQLAGEERFCATYADGLADIDLGALLSSTRPTARSRA